MHLYKYLDRLGERAMYCDTDSLLYIQSEGGPCLIECGDKLGDMTNELGEGEFIEEFVSGGPKNYAYKVRNRDLTKVPKTVCKVRGITLNYTAMQLVNFDVIRGMILKGTPRNSHSSHRQKDQAEEGRWHCLFRASIRTGGQNL